MYKYNIHTIRKIKVEDFTGKCSCIYCHDVRIARGIHTHVDRAHLKLSKYGSGNNGKYDKISSDIKDRKDKEKQEYLLNPNYCPKCNHVMEYKKKDNVACSRKCGASLGNDKRKLSGKPFHSEETLLKMSKIMTGKTFPSRNTLVTCKCKNCKKEFIGKSKRLFCSISCSSKFPEITKDKNILKDYRSLCAFKFSLNDFPNEFEFSLIEEHGWYKAKNHGDNPKGVSRDHIISVRFGFDNKIDPYLISHPANCMLMQHSKNVSKYIKCGMTLDELKNKVEQWNIKYSR